MQFIISIRRVLKTQNIFEILRKFYVYFQIERKTSQWNLIFEEKRRTNKKRNLLKFVGWFAEDFISMFPFIVRKTLTSWNKYIWIANTNCNIEEWEMLSIIPWCECCSWYWKTWLICPLWNKFECMILWCCEVTTPINWKILTCENNLNRTKERTYQIVTKTPAPGKPDEPT